MSSRATSYGTMNERYAHLRVFVEQVGSTTLYSDFMSADYTAAATDLDVQSFVHVSATTATRIYLGEARQLGCGHLKRRKKILAFYDTGASNGPVEAINGNLENPRGIALGLRNPTHYILRSTNGPASRGWRGICVGRIGSIVDR